MLFFLKELLYDCLFLHNNSVKLSVCNTEIDDTFINKDYVKRWHHTNSTAIVGYISNRLVN